MVRLTRVNQPLDSDKAHTDAYLMATHLARRFGCTHVIEIGCGHASQLAKVHPEFGVVGVDTGPNVETCRTRHGFGTWIEWDILGGQPVPDAFSDLLHPFRRWLPTSIVVCVDVLKRAADPSALLASVRQLMEYAPAGVVTGMGAARLDARDDDDVSAAELARFRGLLEGARLRTEFIGQTRRRRDLLLRGGEEEARLPLQQLLARPEADAVRGRRPVSLAILGNNHAPAIGPAPAGYRVVAIVSLYNEQDVIEPCVRTLIEQDVEVYILDNWSTDSSVELVEGFVGKGIIRIEHFPPEGPSDSWELARMLNRIEEIGTQIDADWFMHTDADEVRLSPWRGVSLRDALFHVDRAGFNTVDHSSLQFRPVDDDYPNGASLEQYFRYYSFDPVKDYQIKTWRNTGRRVFLVGGGHRATFAGRRVYPYNFLYKHYPIRSQLHGERKLFSKQGVRARYASEERDAGWSHHYDDWQEGHNFLYEPARLRHFEQSYYDTNLVELLGGLGPEDRDVWPTVASHPRSAASRVRDAAVSLRARLRRRFGRS